MTNKGKTITEKEFSKIFLYNDIQNLLTINIGSYSLLYYFIKEFISLQYYNKEQNISSPHKQIHRSHTINLMLRKFKIVAKLLLSNKPSEKKVDVLLLSRKRICDFKIDKNTTIHSDYLFGPIIYHVRKEHPNYKISFINLDTEMMPEIDYIISKSLLEHSTPITLTKSFFLSTLIYLKWKINKISIIEHIKSNNQDQLISFFNYFFSYKSLFFHVLSDCCLTSALNKSKPRVILANDDVMYFKPKVNNDNLKMAIIQSALSINPNKEKYKSFFIKYFSMTNIADYFYVSGIKFKDMKLNTKDSRQILITGQSRYDFLCDAEKLYDKSLFIKKHNLKPENKLILWATQSHGMSIEENMNNLNALCKAFCNQKNITLIIKQHPDEDVFYTNLIKKQFENCDIDFYIFPQNSDTFELLYISDLMITKDSTVCIEAAILSKPVIIMNLSGKEDIIDYVNDGIGIGVYHENYLFSAVNQILNENCELTEKRSLFINKYLYRIDGKASERIITDIESFLQG